MKVLTDVGVSAVHVGTQTVFEDVAAGKFRFGMLKGTAVFSVIYTVHLHFQLSLYGC